MTTNKIVFPAIVTTVITAMTCCLSYSNSSYAAGPEERVPPDLTGFHNCASIEDDNARLDCYDTLVGRSAAIDSHSAEGVEDTLPEAEETTQATLNDEIGRENIKRETEDRGSIAVRGTVIECRQDVHRKYYFHFVNGQVWKQKGNNRLSFGECRFDVTITKDFFGYKMQADGEDRRIRIARIK